MKEFYKLVVFVPEEAEERVRLSLGEAGTGRIGDYDYCAFVSSGRGHYRPLAGSHPFHGTEGKIETLAEQRLEVICERDRLPAILKALRTSHPYEEISYDIIRLANAEFAHLVPKRPVKKI